MALECDELRGEDYMNHFTAWPRKREGNFFPNGGMVSSPIRSLLVQSVRTTRALLAEGWVAEKIQGLFQRQFE